MCGIAGIFEYGTGPRAEVDPAVLVEMRETLLHRGPDDAGLHLSHDRRLGLAHRRLSIVDLDGGHQPMVGAGGLVLVFNGEIYNFPRLRTRMEREGTSFKTGCDTEIILKLYERYGRDCLEHLDGMFAFALWDPSREEVFFARDRIGEKPFYWSEANGRFIFGSEIKAILKHPAVTAEVNIDAIGPYLTNLVTSSPETLYRGIFKLPPGFAGYCTRSGIETFRYGQVFGDRELEEVSFPSAATEVRERLEESVHRRLMSDVPVGVLLSGGIDSSAITALVKEQQSDVATFSVGFPGGSAIDERTEARRAARYFQSDHYEVSINESDAQSFLVDLVHGQDEPLADPVCVPLNFVCKLAAKEEVKVVLAGEGADELFWGYPRYTHVLSRERELRALLKAPGVLSQALARLAGALGMPRQRELLEGVASGRPLPLMMPLGMTTKQRSRILGVVQPAESGWSPSQTGLREDSIETLFWDTQEYEFGLRLPELLLMRIDRFSMANSVEARVPFLAPSLVEFAYPLPLGVKWQHGVSKRVLREALSGIVPNWILDRKKQGFGAPVDEWFSGIMLGTLENLLDTESITRFFEPDVIRKSLYQPSRRSPIDRSQLWSVFNFALWHRYWIEGLPAEEVLPA